MTFWRLNELRKVSTVEIYTNDKGEAVVELYPQRVVGRPDVTEMLARYVEEDLCVAIRRAWAEEPADG